MIHLSRRRTCKRCRAYQPNPECCKLNREVKDGKPQEDCLKPITMSDWQRCMRIQAEAAEAMENNHVN